MAEFGGMTMTNIGRNILAKALLGKTLKFTRAWAGRGIIGESQNIKEMTQMIEPCCEMKIKDMSIPPHIGTARIDVFLTNKNLSTGFYFNEVGLYAEDPDTGEEILYCYGSAGNTGDLIPGYGGADAVEYILGINVAIEQAQNVIAVFAEDPFAVTHRQLEEANDTLLKHFREREALLQYQIDCLSEASIINSLEHVGQKHWAG